eukprot:SAG22_NODE_853_length_6848_cov_6.656394_10_plen_90_part_00
MTPSIPPCLTPARCVARRAALNQSFVFYEEYPSFLTSARLFRRVQLPHHDAKQWESHAANGTRSVGSDLDRGGIDTDFMATPPVKLGNA